MTLNSRQNIIALYMHARTCTIHYTVRPHITAHKCIPCINAPTPYRSSESSADAHSTFQQLKIRNETLSTLQNPACIHSIFDLSEKRATKVEGWSRMRTQQGSSWYGVKVQVMKDSGSSDESRMTAIDEVLLGGCLVHDIGCDDFTCCLCCYYIVTMPCHLANATNTGHLANPTELVF